MGCRSTSSSATGFCLVSRMPLGDGALGIPLGLSRLLGGRAQADPLRPEHRRVQLDTQIIIQLHDAGMRIAEVPIPTYYGDEICYVDGFGYAADVTEA